MTNQEINKRIAELKGIDVIEIQYGWLLDKHRQSLPSWSSSISDAWELFEEMGGQIITEDRYNGSYSKGKWLCTYGTTCPEEVLLNGPQADDTTAMVFWQNPKLIVAADTAPMAICLAWINWMESK